jgi:lysyl endopeptidase
MKKQLFLLSLLLLGSVSFAQQGDGGRPKGYKSTTDLKSIEHRTFATPDVAALRAEDAINDAEATGPWRFGFNNATALNLNNSGTWTNFANGDKIWRIILTCENALTVNLTFDNITLPEGNELYVYNPEKDFILGKFTAYHLYEGQLGTELVPGNTAIVEYYIPARNASETSTLNINTVTHGYRTSGEYIEKAFGSSGSCNLNVNCPEGAAWTNERNSAVMLVSGSSGFCSGALINNTLNDGKPYVLTADHCYSNPATWIFRFQWQGAGCNNPATSPTFQSLSGGVLRARATASDFCLVEITGGLVANTVPAAYTPYFSGWDNTGATPQSAVGIHHPSGDIKKISFENQPLISTTFGACPANSHWGVTGWDLGVTEGGSSGSPLYDQNHRIIGQLHGGASACGGAVLSDEYGKVSVSWNPAGSANSGQLKFWLDPNNSGAGFVNGYDPSGAVAVALDGGLSNLLVTETQLCGGTFEPTMTISNGGTTTLTAATITYTIDGGAAQTYNWSGSLAQYQTQTITLPTVALAPGAHTFNATLSNPNAGVDENTVNNNTTYSFTIDPIAQTVGFITINFLTDDYADESYLEVRNSSGTLVWAEGNENVAGNFGTNNTPAPTDATNPLANNTQYNWNVPLTAVDCYTFGIYDYYGDGVGAQQWGGTDGDLTISDNASVQIFAIAAADFGGSATTVIKTIDPSSGLENLDNTQIIVYPNPAKDQLTVTAGTKMNRIEFVTVAGQTVFAQTVNNTTATLQLAGISSGMYFVNVYSETGVTVKQVIVK